MSILDTLDELTKERKDHIVPKNDDGTLGKAQKITVKPLIVQIREATYSSSNAKSGSAAQPSTRSVLDFDALTIYANITSWIRAWCVLIELETHNDPVSDLRRWYMYWSSLNPDDNETSERHSKMREWVRQIKDHLDPPKEYTPKYPCPVCGHSEWGDMINGGGLWPVKVTYRLTEEGSRYDDRALCRRCQIVWDGADAVAELGEEMVERHAEGGSC
ncbi:hypothetical protein [Microbacterium sp. MPKO10]|uniref:hypothetical protein n=1 Tax=Microbacterium sp. MPKO10 TaxID=2989818 RepID=UPI00223558AF|nr:hypothetical protein [Microbacterium sp. MPKO10]MCW4458173.1 hypothetical protein [Microbacterium sp. MPKO10]